MLFEAVASYVPQLGEVLSARQWREDAEQLTLSDRFNISVPREDVITVLGIYKI